MKYLQYKGVVEREYKMSLRKIMHKLCVEENLNAVDGAKKLGIAKEVYVYWRHYFRLEKRQILFDDTVEELTKLQSVYSEEMKSTTIPRTIDSSPSDSIDKLEDAVEGLIEYYKYIHYYSEGLSLETAKLPLYEFSRSLIANYKNGEIHKELI